jgi:hypothetical protein
MSKATNRRAFLKLASGASALAAGASVFGLSKTVAAQPSNNIEELAARYFEGGKSEDVLRKEISMLSSLTDDEYESFMKLVGEQAKQIARPFDPDTDAAVDGSIESLMELNAISKKVSGKHLFKLSSNELAKLAGENSNLFRNRKKRASATGKGKGIARPAAAPCYTYTYSAVLGWSWSSPNHIGYYPAAGINPSGGGSCTDSDWEFQYSGYKSLLQQWNIPGQTYIGFLRAGGYTSPLRNFSGYTGRLIGTGSLNLFFAGSPYISGISLGML